MAGASKVTLKAVVPVIPDNGAIKALLHQDMDWMSSARLLERPWCLKDAKMVRELLDGAANQFANTIRVCPDDWTTDISRRVYGFPANENGLCS